MSILVCSTSARVHPPQLSTTPPIPPLRDKHHWGGGWSSKEGLVDLNASAVPYREESHGLLAIEVARRA